MAVKKKFPYRSAFVACNGGCHVTEGSSCSYGCIACGKCVESCKFGAIHLNEHGIAEVDEEKCIACGRCVRAVSYTHLDVYKRQSQCHYHCSFLHVVSSFLSDVLQNRCV